MRLSFRGSSCMNDHKSGLQPCRRPSRLLYITAWSYTTRSPLWTFLSGPACLCPTSSCLHSDFLSGHNLRLGNAELGTPLSGLQRTRTTATTMLWLGSLVDQPPTTYQHPLLRRSADYMEHPRPSSFTDACLNHRALYCILACIVKDGLWVFLLSTATPSGRSCRTFRTRDCDWRQSS
jgi:hypothetical protein